MALQRPASLLVFGILHIAFGTIWILFSLISLGIVLSGLQGKMQQSQKAAASSANPQQNEMADFQVRMQDTMESVPLYQFNQVGTQVVYIILSVLLIVGGIGLILVCRWARAVSLAYAALSILSTIWLFIYFGLILLPTMSALMEQERAKASPALVGVMNIMMYGLYGALAFDVVYFIYPVLVLTWMLKPSTAKALRDGGVEVPDFEDPYIGDRSEPPDYDDRRDQPPAGGGEGFYQK